MKPSRGRYLLYDQLCASSCSCLTNRLESCVRQQRSDPSCSPWRAVGSQSLLWRRHRRGRVTRTTSVPSYHLTGRHNWLETSLPTATNTGRWFPVVLVIKRLVWCAKQHPRENMHCPVCIPPCTRSPASDISLRPRPPAQKPHTMRRSGSVPARGFPRRSARFISRCWDAAAGTVLPTIGTSPICGRDPLDIGGPVLEYRPRSSIVGWSAVRAVAVLM